MSISFAAERRQLAQDEHEPMIRSHHPMVEDLSHEDLVHLARWLRARHGRARDIIRGRRRIASGKADARGTAAETASERGLAAKKQIFASALKRVNARLAKLQADRKRAAALAEMQAALSRKQSATPHHPQPSRTANTGAHMTPSAKRRRIIQAARIGSVSQAGRVAQAARDRRPG